MSALIKELRELDAAGVSAHSRLKISPACPLIMPYHVALDNARLVNIEQCTLCAFKQDIFMIGNMLMNLLRNIGNHRHHNFCML
jgi:hypothetical protein